MSPISDKTDSQSLKIESGFLQVAYQGSVNPQSGMTYNLKDVLLWLEDLRNCLSEKSFSSIEDFLTQVDQSLSPRPLRVAFHFEFEGKVISKSGSLWSYENQEFVTLPDGTSFVVRWQSSNPNWSQPDWRNWTLSDWKVKAPELFKKSTLIKLSLEPRPLGASFIWTANGDEGVQA